MANNNIAVDLASEVDGLPAWTATLPLFPSDAKLVEKEEFQELRLALLQLVEQKRAHVNASKYATILDILWGAGAKRGRADCKAVEDSDGRAQVIQCCKIGGGEVQVEGTPRFESSSGIFFGSTSYYGAEGYCVIHSRSYRSQSPSQPGQRKFASGKSEVREPPQCSP